MAKSKSKSKTKNKVLVAFIRSTQQSVEERPPPNPSVDWRSCINCGCFEPFQRRTEECCWNEFKKECVFITGLAIGAGSRL